MCKIIIRERIDKGWPAVFLLLMHVLPLEIFIFLIK